MPKRIQIPMVSEQQYSKPVAGLEPVTLDACFVLLSEQVVLPVQISSIALISRIQPEMPATP